MASVHANPRQEAAFELAQREVLERIAAGAPLTQLLEAIVLLIEQQEREMLCSILLLNEEYGTLQHGAAPSLPDAFIRQLDGSKIGPREGSCGAAAYLRERVIVEDIAGHPYWVNYSALALKYGLRACWSTPILAATGSVLGTFAMYFRQPRAPTEQQLMWVSRATHLAAIAIDRERADQKARANERLRALVYNVATDVLFCIAVEPDGDFRFTSVNPAFLKATGLSEADVVGRLVRDVIPPMSLDLVLANYRRAMAERRTITWVEVTPYPAGLKHGEVSITPVLDDQGYVTTLVGAVHDVTSYREAQERIEAQAALLEKAKDAICVRDMNGVVQYWNRGAQNLYGWTSAEAIGRHVSELSYRDVAAFDRAHTQLIARGEWTGELNQVTRDGKPLIVEASWTLLRDETEQPKSVLCIHTDITQKKQLEAQVYRAQRMDSLGALAGGIAHDFNNVLTVICANVGLAITDVGKDHPALEALTAVKLASARATDLVHQILTFSRQQETQRRRVKLETIVAEALKLLGSALPARIVMRTDFSHNLPEILADPTQVHQVAMNLATNAVHAMEARGGTLSVRTECVIIESAFVAGTNEIRPGEYAKLVVSDNGSGMDEATLERIFDPFFTTKPHDKGTGLGLSVVHGIIKSHAGGIVVQSALGTGTEVHVYFPTARNV